MNFPLTQLLIIVITILVGAKTPAEEIQSRFDRSWHDMETIPNIEIEWLDTLNVGESSQKGLNAITPKLSRTYHYSYVYSKSGPKYRAMAQLVSGNDTNLFNRRMVTFDGKSHVYYNYDTDYMVKGSEKDMASEAEDVNNPLVAPFEFLSKSSDDCIACVLTYAGLAGLTPTNDLNHYATNISNGLMEIIIPGLQLEHKPTIWKITIEDVGDYFTPATISHVFPESGVEVFKRLLNYTNIGTYYFPTRIEWTENSYPPTVPATVLSSGVATIISINNPSQIADDTFQFEKEEKSSKTIWNWNQKQFIKQNTIVVKAKISAGIARNLLLLLLFTTGILPIIFMLYKAVVSKRAKI